MKTLIDDQDDAPKIDDKPVVKDEPKKEPSKKDNSNTIIWALVGIIVLIIAFTLFNMTKKKDGNI